MPAGLIEQQHRMSPRRDCLGDLGQMERHGLGRAARQNQAGAFALGRTDRSEDVRRSRPEIARGRGTGSALSPTPGDLVLLADPRLIGKPDLYGLAASLGLRDLRQTRGEVFLKADTAASLLAWCCGRAESLR